MKLRPLRHRPAGRAIASLPGAATRPAIARLATTRPSAAAYVVVAATTSLGALLPDDRLHAVTKHLVAPLAALDVEVNVLERGLGACRVLVREIPRTDSQGHLRR